MKRKLLLLIVAFFAIGFSACQKEKTTQTPESVAIITQPQSKGETAVAGTRPVTIAATCKWVATSDAEWISVEPASGDVGIQEINLSFGENTTGNTRIGNVTFTAGDYSETFTLTQNAN